MSCVRPPEMSRLEEVESDEEGPAHRSEDVLSCGGCLWSCLTPKVAPPAESVATLEEQAIAGSPSDHSEAAGPGLERKPSLLEGLVGVLRASLSWTTNLQRKPQVASREVICCWLELVSAAGLCPVCSVMPCPVCSVMLCPACDTLHSHPDYIHHCLLEHPTPPLPDQDSGQDPDTPRSVSPFTPRSVSPVTPRSVSPVTPRSVSPVTPRSVTPAHSLTSVPMDPTCLCLNPQ